MREMKVSPETDAKLGIAFLNPLNDMTIGQVNKVRIAIQHFQTLLQRRDNCDED